MRNCIVQHELAEIRNGELAGSVVFLKELNYNDKPGNALITFPGGKSMVTHVWNLTIYHYPILSRRGTNNKCLKVIRTQK